MNTKYIPPFVTLLAAAISCICSIVKQTDVTQALIRLLIVIVIFYIIGRIAQKMLLWVLELSVANSAEEAKDAEGISAGTVDNPDEDAAKESAAKGPEGNASQTGDDMEMNEL